MVNRIVLQMDQAAFANQGVLWDIRKRSKNTNPDSNLGLCTYCLGKKRLNLDITLYIFSIDFERQCIRASRYFTISYESHRHNARKLCL